MGNLKNGKAASKGEFTGEMVMRGDDIMVDWIWRLFIMTFGSSVVPRTGDVL